MTTTQYSSLLLQAVKPLLLLPVKKTATHLLTIMALSMLISACGEEQKPQEINNTATCDTPAYQNALLEYTQDFMAKETSTEQAEDFIYKIHSIQQTGTDDTQAVCQADVRVIARTGGSIYKVLSYRVETPGTGKLEIIQLTDRDPS